MDRPNNNRKQFYYLAVGLYAIISSPLPVSAEVSNVAGPTASATGNVTNQAVQVLQGPYPITTFGQGVSCPGPALTVAPFVTNSINNSTDPESYQSYSGGFGFTVGFSTPLNGSITETCLEAARTTIARNQAEADKARLDFELVRLIKCGEAARMGVRFHPNSPYAGICSDIVVVNPNPPPAPTPPPPPQS